MGVEWARSLYSLVTWAGQPLLRWKLRRRARQEPGYGEQVPERFGHYARTLDSLLPPAEDGRVVPLVWLHAVSLGETRAAAVLLRELRAALPGMRLLLTHGTATGRAEGRKLLQPGDVQVWQPWDSRGAVRRFVRHFRPTLGILMETEIWPNLLAACREEKVPVVLANARLNARSLRAARRLAPLALPAYRGLTAVLAQADADADALRSLGAPVRAVLGNVKFDMQPDERLWSQGRAWREASARPVVLFASSREGEEVLWLQALRQWERQHPDLCDLVQWMVVPRHPQRFDEVAALLQAQGLSVSRRSQWVGMPRAASVWLGDTLGEMSLYYGLADVALLGGSFAPLGGQNLIEAAACACPVFLGPHTFNFEEVAQQACRAAAAVRVPDLTVAVDAAAQLVMQPEALEVARRKAVSFAKAHRGAARASALEIRRLLEAQGVPLAPLPETPALA